MSILSSVRFLAIGGVFGLFASDIASNAINNYMIHTFQGNTDVPLSLLLPAEYQEWTEEYALPVLSPRVDHNGIESCIHVRPLLPEYQVRATLPNGEKICCNLKEGQTSVPARKGEGYVDYYCGEYPDQQIVRVLNEDLQDNEEGRL